MHWYKKSAFLFINDLGLNKFCDFRWSSTICGPKNRRSGYFHVKVGDTVWCTLLDLNSVLDQLQRSRRLLLDTRSRSTSRSTQSKECSRSNDHRSTQKPGVKQQIYDKQNYLSHWLTRRSDWTIPIPSQSLTSYPPIYARTFAHTYRYHWHALLL
jgi:hypothetical protein